MKSIFMIVGLYSQERGYWFFFGGELHTNDSVFGAFLEGGAELRIDSEIINLPGTSNDQSIEGTRFGGVVGGGLCVHILCEIKFWILISLGLRYHIIQDSFLSMSIINMGVRFGI